MMNIIHNLNKKEKGFTLIELMIVVAIIGILAAIAIPQFSEYRKKAFNGAANADLRNVMTAQEASFAESQAYITEASIRGPLPAASLPAVRISKNVQLRANASGGSPDAYAAFTGHTEGSQEYGGDSIGRIQRKASTAPHTAVAAEAGTTLSGWGGTDL